jgi:hypothetical protein
LTPAGQRHLSIDSFRRYLDSGVPIDHPIPGEPRLILFIDPLSGRIGLRGQASPNDTVRPTGLEHLAVRTLQVSGKRQIEVSVTDHRLFTDAYPLLCAIADRVQLHGQRIPVALSETIRKLGHLLETEERIPREIEVGLIGELCVLGGLAVSSGPDFALAAWGGALAEEHDFSLPGADIEVKTTASDRRLHWVTSLGQLTPTGDRPLWLVSVQLTRAGSGGTSLPGLIRRIRSMFTNLADRNAFDDRLRGAGWRNRWEQNCEQRWRHRARPLSYPVEAQFPRLSPELIRADLIDVTAIREVRYQIDLTGHPDTTPPATIADAMEAAHLELT